MKHSEIEIPSSALDFYVKLYCKKRRENKTKLSNVVSEATKSWLTLSKSEKYHFTTKYQQIKNTIKSQFANQLKNAVPYLKRKAVPVPRSIDESYTNEDVIEGDTVLNVKDQTATQVSEILNVEEDIADTNSFSEQNTANHEIPSHDQSNGNLYENHNIPISEPIPPKLLTSEELFNMVNKTKNNLLWPALTKMEKRKYQNAVLLIKRNYLNEYKKYLEQLPSEKLYEHYKNKVSSV